MPDQEQPIPKFSLGIAGSGPFSIATRECLDAYIRYCYALFPDRRPMRVVVAVETPFERRTVERVAALRRVFPQMTLTVMVFCDIPYEAAEALADEVLIGEELDEKHYFLSDLCDEVIDLYGPSQRVRSRALRRIAGPRVRKMAGRKVLTIRAAMLSLARFCGLVPPGRLAEDRGPEELPQ